MQQHQKFQLVVKATILLHKCNGFEITSAWEEHVVEDDILFTNHQVGK